MLLLVLPIPIGWFFNILLHARLDTDFYLLSTKEKLIHLLSTTWFTVPVRRMEERDQRHKGREKFFAVLIAGLNLIGTSVATLIKVIQHRNTVWVSYFLGSYILSLFLYLLGCRLLLFFEKSVHPWRLLGRERERQHLFGKLQGTKRGIETEPTLWEQVSERRLFNVHFHFLREAQRRMVWSRWLSTIGYQSR